MTAMQMGSNIELAGATVRAAVRWTAGPSVPEVDASALLLHENGQVGGDTDFVFFNQPQHPSGSVRLAGRVATPMPADQIDVDLAAVPADVARIVLAASATGGTFGQVPGFEIVLTDLGSGAHVCSFAMQADDETAFLCGELYRRGEKWKFRAVGQGYASGLAGLAGDFGIATGEAAPATAAPAPPAPASPPPASPAPASPPPAPPARASPPPAAPPTAGPPPAAPAAAPLDLTPPAPPPPPPAAPAAPAPAVPADGALDLDKPWPPR